MFLKNSKIDFPTSKGNIAHHWLQTWNSVVIWSSNILSFLRGGGGANKMYLELKWPSYYDTISLIILMQYLEVKLKDSLGRQKYQYRLRAWTRSLLLETENERELGFYKHMARKKNFENVYRTGNWKSLSDVGKEWAKWWLELEWQQ